VKYKEQAASKKEIKQVVPEAVKFKYLYNGKELQDELGLNIYDYGARTYDPAVLRFWQVDPDTEKYQNQSVYIYADDSPVRFRDVDGKGTEDWYEKLDENGNGTGEVTWFDGSNEIEGYKHIGYDYVVTNTDVNGNRTQIKYDGDTKSSYIYNIETGKFEFLKNYDYSDSGNLNKIKSFAYDKLNGPLVVSDQLLKSLIVGFQGAGIAMYEGIVNKKELDGINLTKLGYKPIMNIERTPMYNNGKWVYVNLHSQGNQAFFKEYTKSLIKITPASKIIKVVKNKYINIGIISILKKKAINWLDNQ